MSIWLWCVAVGLSVALAASVTVILLLKKDLRQLGQTLEGLAEVESNARVTTATFDRDIVGIANGMNRLLEGHAATVNEKRRTEQNLKRAITNISHDLRTPLTSAMGYLQMLEAELQESDAVDEDARRRYVQMVRDRLTALSVLLNELFAFTRIVEGDVHFDVKQWNVGGLLRDVLSSHYPELVEKGFEVEALIPDEPLYAHVDETAFRRVLQNVFKNVVQHGSNYVKVWAEGNKIHVANRMGDSSDVDESQMFERFYTSDASRTSKHAGLGLAIAKELMVRMGGDVTANKEEERLVITLELPPIV